MISVVIASLNDERRLVPTLSALVPGAAAGLITEVIIADGGSTDETALVADLAGCKFREGPADPGARLQSAAGTAKAPWLMFLPPGSVPEDGWTGEVGRFVEAELRRRADDPRAAAFSIDADGYGPADRFAARLAHWRALLGLGTAPEQGLLIARIVYASVGGHGAGHDAERRLTRRLGRRIVPLRASVSRIDLG